ncbi:HK97 gp10 family phage protein [Clavibacter sp. VKM Ac-2872]|uniref:HK97 gp10 family phage protein n=1 Tax=Clavibacter sp. VKM Ac-2872 TaxID=2783812 RepID=UPI00188AB270|nr:HK97 gp10 family phage protein [Clavibacter sp. VKM Ac-2872]MBF4625546.1 HK97 gp10 family phage protein [Clavibacter sp. VKM Ac-2872]
MEFNQAFFEELGRSGPVIALTDEAAERVAAAARASAPVDTHAYQEGIVVRRKFQDRAVALVVGTDPKTMLIEAKTGNLARAVKAARKSG